MDITFLRLSGGFGRGGYSDREASHRLNLPDEIWVGFRAISSPIAHLPIWHAKFRFQRLQVFFNCLALVLSNNTFFVFIQEILDLNDASGEKWYFK